MEKIKSRISESSKNLANNIEFYVVEKPRSIEDDPMALTYKSDPISFGLQIAGGLQPQQIHGFFESEDQATSAAHDLVSSAFNKAKAFEAKKNKVSNKIQKAIDKFEKEVSKHLKAAKSDPENADAHHAQAEQFMEKIKNLRSKHKLVEKSKKTILDKEIPKTK